MNDRRHQGPERVCPGCGFDLTNPTGPVCPECGGPSSTALHPSVLRRRFPILAILLSAEHALLALGFMAFYAQVTHNGFAAASTSLVFWAIPLGVGVAIVLLLLGGIFRVRLGAAGAACLQALIAVAFTAIGWRYSRGPGIVIATALVLAHAVAAGILLRHALSMKTIKRSVARA